MCGGADKRWGGELGCSSQKQIERYWNVGGVGVRNITDKNRNKNENRNMNMIMIRSRNQRNAMWAFLLLIAEVLMKPTIGNPIKYQLTDPKGAALCVNAGLVTVIDTDATHHHQSQEIIEKQKSTTTSSIHVRVCPLAEEIMF